MTRTGRSSRVLKPKTGLRRLRAQRRQRKEYDDSRANGGKDIELPYAQFLRSALLRQGDRSGQVSMATIDDHVLRLLRTYVPLRVRPPEWWRAPRDRLRPTPRARRIEESGSSC